MRGDLGVAGLASTTSPYWHYDVLQALLGASAASRIPGQGQWRCAQTDGRQRWNPPGRDPNAEVVACGTRGPNVMVTLNALRIMKSAGVLRI
jgi:hypothetical protein